MWLLQIMYTDENPVSVTHLQNVTYEYDRKSNRDIFLLYFIDE